MNAGRAELAELWPGRRTDGNSRIGGGSVYLVSLIVGRGAVVHGFKAKMECHRACREAEDV